MALTAFKIGKSEFVIISRRRYDSLLRAERDRKDAEIARKGLGAVLRGRVKTISHEQLKRQLGI